MKLPPNARSFVPAILVIARMSPFVRSNDSGVALMSVVGATCASDERLPVPLADGLGQSSEAGSSFIALGESIALQAGALPELAAAAGGAAAKTAVVARTPTPRDAVTLRMSAPPGRFGNA